jgi:hypothetical protein
MDESTVSREGGAWPPVLKFVVCQLLMEITAYIRETYKAVPKVCSHQVQGIALNGISIFWPRSFTQK